MKKSFYLLSAIIAILFGTAANAQTISSHYESTDSALCQNVYFQVMTAGCTSGQTVKIYHGDGTTQTNAVTCSSSTGWSSGYHIYATSGTYTIKEVLYNGTSPVDSITFTRVVSYCDHIWVASYLDMNSNCVNDAGDAWVYTPMSIKIDSSGTPIDTISMTGGAWYEVYGPIGTFYTFTVLTPPAGLATACPTSGIVTTSVTASSSSTITPTVVFGFNCATSSTFDLSIAATFRPALTGGGANKASIALHNSSCTGTPATVKFEFGPKYAFSAIYPATTTYTVSGSSVTFSAGTVSTYLPKSFQVVLTPTVTLTIGDTVNTKFTVYPTSGDAYPANNVVIRCDTVRASYDPNQKSVTPTGPIAAGMQLEYMLEFENTGNAPAENIYIMDTLSNYLDINTFIVGKSTHKVEASKYISGGANILKFNFPNINLPDSSDHDNCRGMVTFTINAKTTLTPGTTIANRVGIYFDTNPVVLTNTVYSKIPLPSSIPQAHRLTAVELYPNPVKDVLHITTENGAYTAAAIYNIMGQLIATQTIIGGSTDVNVQSLLPDIYYVSLKGTSGVRSIKFEKQ